VSSFDADLQSRLAALREHGLLRELRRVDSPQGSRIEVDGRTLLNFSSNDYLGLANHPALKEAAVRALKDFGAGAGASRLLCGSLAPLHQLEETLAAFKDTEAALTFSTGYATAIGTLTALLGRADIVILDKLVHACIVDASRLSGARLRVFAHNDLNALEARLKWAVSQIRRAKQEGRILIVTESVFSMDGDQAPLAGIVGLKEKYGAWLMVDEAHSTGLFGPKLRGLAEELGVGDQIEIQMGTLGKALGASGGYICGSRPLIDLLVNRARSFIYSTAPGPAAAAAATAAIKLVQTEKGRSLNATLWKRVSQFKSAFRIPHSAMESPIIPIILGDEATAVAAAARLREQDLFIPAIRFPSVARGSARLRVTLSAAHSESEVAQLATALSAVVNPQSFIVNAPARAS